MVELYRNVVNNAAMKRVKVGVECVGGELNQESCGGWSSVAYNKIQKRYFGPTSGLKEDIISFLVLDTAVDS